MADLKTYTVSVTDKRDDLPCPGVPSFMTRGVGFFDKDDPKHRSVTKPLPDDVARQLARDGFKVEPEPPLPPHIADGEKIRLEREAAEAKSKSAEKPIVPETTPVVPAKTGKE